MDGRHKITLLGLALAFVIDSPARTLSQEIITPPAQPAIVVEAAPMTSVAVADAGDSHPGLRRLWNFITFQQPPRPRECRECTQFSVRCTPPLYEYFQNRYPHGGTGR